MNTWKPISVVELENLLKVQLDECSPVQQKFYEKYCVPPYKVPIHRFGVLEEVYVVAKLPSGVLYYEDVEESFEVDLLGKDGAIPTQGCNQYALKHVLSQLV